MRDPRPVFWLVAVQALLLLALAGWWFNLTLPERLAHLRAVMRDEHVLTTPPDGLWAQAVWLTTHRRCASRHVVGRDGSAGGWGKGSRGAARTSGAFRRWDGRVVGFALLPACIGGYLVAPWPLPGLWGASGLAVLVSLMTYGLMAGRPYVP
jgi:hypothetical protein